VPIGVRNNPSLYIIIVNQSKKRHQLAISLLKELGLDHIRLESRKDGSFGYVAWTTPLADTNGHTKRSRCGTVRLEQAR
jgi:hypothetical protein